LYRDGIARMGNLVVLIQVHQLGFEGRQFLLGQANISANDHNITRVGLVGSGAIDRNNARTILSANGIGSKTLTIGGIVDFDLLVFADPRDFEQLTIDRT
jgi:hypothetical protein